MKTADWYFDFISPYAYLQSTRLKDFAKKVVLRPRPVLFAGLLNHHGQLGPAEIAPKRQFIFRQVLWQAQRQGTPMKLPPHHPFNPLPPLRLALALDCDIGAIQTIFNFIWRDGRDVDAPDEWSSLAAELGVANVAERIAEPAVKEALRKNTEQACACGVFGVPTFVIDNEIFWGHDAAEFFLDYLDNPGSVKSTVFDPVVAFPQGNAQRKRSA